MREHQASDAPSRRASDQGRRVPQAENPLPRLFAPAGGLRLPRVARGVPRCRGHVAALGSLPGDIRRLSIKNRGDIEMPRIIRVIRMPRALTPAAVSTAAHYDVPGGGAAAHSEAPGATGPHLHALRRSRHHGELPCQLLCRPVRPRDDHRARDQKAQDNGSQPHSRHNPSVDSVGAGRDTRLSLQA